MGGWVGGGGEKVCGEGGTGAQRENRRGEGEHDVCWVLVGFFVWRLFGDG